MIHTVRRFPALAPGTLLLAAAPSLPGAGATVPTTARRPRPDAAEMAARHHRFGEEAVARLDTETERRALPALREAGRPFVAAAGGAQ